MSIACCPCYLPHRARLNHPSGVGWFSLRVWRVEILKNHNSCGLKKVWPVGFHLWLECFHKVTLYLGKPLDHSHHLPLDCCSQHAPQSGVRCIERERERFTSSSVGWTPLMSDFPKTPRVFLIKLVLLFGHWYKETQFGIHCFIII